MATVEGVRKHWKQLLHAAERSISDMRAEKDRALAEAYQNARSVVELQRRVDVIPSLTLAKPNAPLRIECACGWRGLLGVGESHKCARSHIANGDGR